MKTKLQISLIWLLLLILALFLLFFIPDKTTSVSYITCAFDVLSFIVLLIVPLTIKNGTDSFNKSSIKLSIAIYSIVQFIWSTITALLINVDIISIKVSIIVNIIIAIVFCSFIISQFASINQIQKIDSRQINHRDSLNMDSYRNKK